MSGTITALKAQERSKDRVSVYLDGEFAFGLALIHALWLRIGQQLSDDEISSLKEADTLEKAKTRALGLISNRPRSVHEVRQRLARAGVDEEAVTGVITDLQNAGLLNDATFSSSWVESRLDASPRSRKMIAWELRRKGINEATIQAALQAVNDDDAAYQLALKRWSRVAKLPNARERRQKLSEHLARHGFSYDIIRDVISKIEQEMNTALDSAEEPEEIAEFNDAAE